MCQMFCWPIFITMEHSVKISGDRPYRMSCECVLFWMDFLYFMFESADWQSLVENKWYWNFVRLCTSVLESGGTCWLLWSSLMFYVIQLLLNINIYLYRYTYFLYLYFSFFWANFWTSMSSVLQTVNIWIHIFLHTCMNQ